MRKWLLITLTAILIAPCLLLLSEAIYTRNSEIRLNRCYKTIPTPAKLEEIITALDSCENHGLANYRENPPANESITVSYTVWHGRASMTSLGFSFDINCYKNSDCRKTGIESHGDSL